MPENELPLCGTSPDAPVDSTSDPAAIFAIFPFYRAQLERVAKGWDIPGQTFEDLIQGFLVEKMVRYASGFLAMHRKDAAGSIGFVLSAFKHFLCDEVEKANRPPPPPTPPQAEPPQKLLAHIFKNRMGTIRDLFASPGLRVAGEDEPDAVPYGLILLLCDRLTLAKVARKTLGTSGELPSHWIEDWVEPYLPWEYSENEACIGPFHITLRKLWETVRDELSKGGMRRQEAAVIAPLLGISENRFSQWKRRGTDHLNAYLMEQGQSDLILRRRAKS